MTRSSRSGQSPPCNPPPFGLAAENGVEDLVEERSGPS